MLTTRAAVPSAASCSAAATQSETSLPVPIKMTSAERPKIAQDVGAAREAGGRRKGRGPRSEGLTAEDEARRTMLESQNNAPGFSDFIGIGRAT